MTDPEYTQPAVDSQPPVLTKLDRAFLPGESQSDRERLPPGRADELASLCEWHDDWVWYDDEPLFLVVEKEVTVTTYTRPDGTSLGLR